MDKMIKSYESRMKTFVLKMAQTPIIIKKANDKFSTTREEFLAKTSNHILDKKGFTFKYYKTDRERINQMIKDKKESDKYIPKSTKSKRKIIDWGENKLVQPSMRFTARCDLERVFDVLQQREFISNQQKLVKDQMAKMGFASQNIDEYDDESSNNDTSKDKDNIENNLINEDKFLTEEEKIKKMRHNKIIQDRKMMIARRNIYLGSYNSKKIIMKMIMITIVIYQEINRISSHYAKHLREELYRKTHFRVMENLTMFKTSTMNHNIFKTWSKEDKRHQKRLRNDKILFYKSLSKKFRNLLKESRDKNMNKYYSNINGRKPSNDLKDSDKKSESDLDDSKLGLSRNRRIFTDLEINKELMTTNPLLYNLNFNTLKNEDRYNDKSNKNQNRALKKLAFVKSNSPESSFAEYEGFGGGEDLKKEENIIIDGNIIKSQILI